jgi:hypothetical protein
VVAILPRWLYARRLHMFFAGQTWLPVVASSMHHISTLALPPEYASAGFCSYAIAFVLRAYGHQCIISHVLRLSCVTGALHSILAATLLAPKGASPSRPCCRHAEPCSTSVPYMLNSCHFVHSSSHIVTGNTGVHTTRICLADVVSCDRRDNSTGHTTGLRGNRHSNSGRMMQRPCPSARRLCFFTSRWLKHAFACTLHILTEIIAWCYACKLYTFRGQNDGCTDLLVFSACLHASVVHLSFVVELLYLLWL